MSALIHRLLLSATLVFAPLALAADNTAAGASPTASATTAPATKKPVSKASAETKKVAPKTASATAAKKTAAKKPAAKTASAQKSTNTKSTKKPVAKADSKKTKASASKKATAAKPAKAAAKVAAAAPRIAPIDFSELNAYPKVARAYMVKVGDEVVWEDGSEQRLPPASLTKMMTALLVVESYRPNDVVEVSAEAAAEGGSRLGLRAGDRVLLSDLLAATLIRSANDACHALADWHSGSEAVFVARMNQRAEQLGLKDTHFMNACGFDNPQHFSTARDLATIAETAMNNPTFARIVTKERMAFRSVDGRRSFRVKTTNHLLGALDGIEGVKTGFTNGAGPCLVAMATRNNERVTLVLLNAKNRWWNATAMIDSAFVEGRHVVAQRESQRQRDLQQAQATTTSTPVSAPANAALAHGA